MNAPRSSTETLIAAMKILARDIQSDDGVANAAISEAANRLIELNEAARMLDHLIEHCTYLEDGRCGNTTNVGDCWMAEDEDRADMPLVEYLLFRVGGNHVPEFWPPGMHIEEARVYSSKRNDDAKAKLEHAHQVAQMTADASEIASADRVIAWATDPNRKPAINAFTAGPERQAAYWIEWAETRKLP